MGRGWLVLLGALLALGAWWLLGGDGAEEGDDGAGSAARPPDEPGTSPTATLAGRAEAAPRDAATGSAPGREETADAPRPPPTRGAGLLVQVETEGDQPLPASTRVTITPVGGPPSTHDIGPSGRLAIDGLPAGDVRVSAVAAGWVMGCSFVPTLVSGEWTEAPLLLERVITLSGRVVGDADGAPVAGAHITAAQGGYAGGAYWTVSGDVYGTTVTGPDGRFRFEALPLDVGLSLLVVASGYRRAEVGLQFAEGPKELAAREIRLMAGGSLVGRVLGPRGEAVPEARVEVEPSEEDFFEDSRWPHAAVADEAGGFEVHGLPFDVDLDAVAFAGGTLRSGPLRRFRVSGSAAVLRRDFELRTPGRLVLEVVGSEGTPVAASADLTPSGDEPRSASGAGRIVFDEVAREREHAIVVTAPGHAPFEQTLVTEADDETVVRVALQPGLVIEGKVVDDLGTPLAGARVTLGERLALTDAPGHFRFEDLGPKPVTLRARSPGNTLWAQPHVITPPATDVVLVTPRPCEVRLRLVLPEGAAPPEKVRVSESGSGGGATWGPESWKDGVVSWTLRPGRYDLMVRVRGCMPVRKTVDARPGESIDLGDVRLGPGILLTGRVVDAAGAPVAGALLETPGANPVSVLTDERGEFRLPDLAPGRIAFDVTAVGFLPTVLEADLGLASDPSVVTLHRGSVIRGTVTDARGRAVPEREVVATALSPQGPYEDPGAEALTDDEGRFEIRVTPGRYRVAAGEVSEAVEAEVADGATVDVALRVP